MRAFRVAFSKAETGFKYKPAFEDLKFGRYNSRPQELKSAFEHRHVIAGLYLNVIRLIARPQELKSGFEHRLDFKCDLIVLSAETIGLYLQTGFDTVNMHRIRLPRRLLLPRPARSNPKP
jgi:hypothetical protein